MIKLSAFLVLALASKLACANMIVNGGFESGATGWTVTQPYACTGISTTVFQEGAKSASAGCSPAATIKQTISGFTVGETYTLSYWIKDVQGGSSFGAPTFSATLGGTVLQSLAPTAVFDWTQHSFDWVASNTAAELSFSALQTRNGNNWYLDNIVLGIAQRVEVSEPGSMLLLGIGAMMLGFGIRKVR